MKNKLLLYSGGMDSTTLLYQKVNEIALCVSFNYGSKHNEIEIEYAKRNCDKFNIPHIIINLDFINKYFKSDLLKNGGNIPEGHYEDDNMKSTVVPFRNGIMLSICAGLAESYNLDYIMIANHFGDFTIYPDCRKDFIEPMKEAILNGTYNKIIIDAPYTSITKKEIALIGKKLNIDYSQSYSCYNGDEIHCGLCGTCVERKEALFGFDPTKYKN